MPAAASVPFKRYTNQGMGDVQLTVGVIPQLAALYEVSKLNDHDLPDISIRVLIPEVLLGMNRVQGVEQVIVRTLDDTAMSILPTSRLRDRAAAAEVMALVPPSDTGTGILDTLRGILGMIDSFNCILIPY